VKVRRATPADAAGLVSLINRAFVVEQFFLDGDRISLAQLQERMAAGLFVIAEEAPEAAPVGTVYLEQRPGGRVYIGLLSVAPGRQGQGIGTRLMQAAHDYAREQGCATLEITVVNLRTELFPFYEAFGFRAIGEEPFPNPSKRPCHLVVMSKPLL
jgi:predicted N-acetyltransferase YhbS